MTAVRIAGVFTYFMMALILPAQIYAVVHTPVVLQIILWLTVVPFTWATAIYTAKVIQEMWND